MKIVYASLRVLNYFLPTNIFLPNVSLSLFYHYFFGKLRVVLNSLIPPTLWSLQLGPAISHTQRWTILISFRFQPVRSSTRTDALRDRLTAGYSPDYYYFDHLQSKLCFLYKLHLFSLLPLRKKKLHGNNLPLMALGILFCEHYCKYNLIDKRNHVLKQATEEILKEWSVNLQAQSGKLSRIYVYYKRQTEQRIGSMLFNNAKEKSQILPDSCKRKEK